MAELKTQKTTASVASFLAAIPDAGRRKECKAVARLMKKATGARPRHFWRGFGCKALAMTYSCMRMHTTIGAAAFHFRVRNGIGWCHSAMVARERVEGRGLPEQSRSRSHWVGM